MEEKKHTPGFIKASERLPERGKRVNGKLNGRAVIVENMNLLEGFISAGGNLEKIDTVEWLDENELVRAYNSYDDMVSAFIEIKSALQKNWSDGGFQGTELIEEICDKQIAKAQTINL